MSKSVPPENLKLYEKLVAMTPGVERKGAAMPYTSVNGQMFSFLTPHRHIGPPFAGRRS